MNEEHAQHAHDYHVAAWVTTTPAKIAKMERELQSLFDNGWLPAGGFSTIFALPKGHVFVAIFARNHHKESK